MFLHYLLILMLAVTGCTATARPDEATTATKQQPRKNINWIELILPGMFPPPDPRIQISQYIRRMLQDKDGSLWLGTNGDGAVVLNDKGLKYYGPNDGFLGYAVRGMLQDSKGTIWFATDRSVGRYDGKKTSKGQPIFTFYTEADGLPHNQVWCIMKDKAGVLWVGTEGGVCCLKAEPPAKGKPGFIPFSLPIPDLGNQPNAYPAPKLVNHIVQDKSGNIWFATNGGGVYRYNGTTLTNLSEKEGLCNNFVQCIFQDSKGMFWFGSRFGGMSRYDGKAFTTFNADNALKGNFVWTMLEDKQGDLWIGSAGAELARYNGKTFTFYSIMDRLHSKHIQSLLQDKDGNIWVGTSGGLYRFNGKFFENITKNDAGC